MAQAPDADDLGRVVRPCHRGSGGGDRHRAACAATALPVVASRWAATRRSPSRNGPKARRRGFLSSAEVPGLYLLRSRFLSKSETMVFLLLRAAFPRHEIFARIRLADVLQVKIGPQGMERLRAFRKIANQHVGFVDLRPRHDDRRDRRFARARPARRTRATRSSKSSSSAACRPRRSSTSASIPHSFRGIGNCASRFSGRLPTSNSAVGRLEPGRAAASGWSLTCDATSRS